MLSASLQRQVQGYERTMRILWISLTVSVLFFVGVLYVQVGPGGGASWTEAPVLGAAGLAIALLVAALLYRGTAFSASSMEALLEREPNVEDMAKDPQSGKVDEKRKAELSELSSRELRVLAALYGLQTPFLVSLVLSEAVALVGFVAAFLARDFAVLIPFAAAALVLNLTSPPRVARWTEQLIRLGDTVAA